MKIKTKISLLFIFILALALRLIRPNEIIPFSSGDIAGNILMALQFYPHLPLSSYFNGIFGIYLGPLTYFLVFMVSIFLDSMGIKLTEFTITFALILSGSLLPIAVFYLTKMISEDIFSSLLAALFSAIWIVNIAMSRVLMNNQVVAILFLVLAVASFIRYIKHGKGVYVASLLIGLYALSDNQFLAIIPLLMSIPLFLGRRSLKDYLKPFLNWRLYLFPIILLSPFILSQVYFIIKGIPTAGYLGHLFSKKMMLGFYVVERIKNLIGNTGAPFAILFSFGLIYGLRKSLQLKKEGIFIIWFFFYSVPWLFLVEWPITIARGYLMQMNLPLIILTACFIGIFIKKVGPKAKFVAKILLVGIVLYTIIIGVNILYSYKLLDLQPRYGVYSGELFVWENPGTKTAGYYFREFTKPESSIFSTFDPSLGNYYFHRKMYGSADEYNLSKAYIQFMEKKDEIDFVIVKKDEVNLSKDYLIGFKKVAEIKVKQQTVLSIYSKEEKEFKILNVEEYDNLFDKQYGNVKDLFNENVWQ